MKTMIAAMVCVVIDDQDETRQGLPRRNPFDDLIERMRREMQSGRDSVKWREADESNVA